MNKKYEFPCTMAFKTDFFDGEITIEMDLSDEEALALKEVYKKDYEMYYDPSTIGIYLRVADKIYRSAVGLIPEDDIKDFAWALKREGDYPDSFLASPLFYQYLFSIILRISVGFPKEIIEA